MLPVVAKHSDESMTAAQIVAAQAARLRRLREQLGLQQVDAAALAKVTRFAWRRMEAGEKRIDAVSLHRFLGYRNITADYVISGKLSGLPEDLIEELARRSASAPPPGAAAAGTGSAPPGAPSGTSRRRSKAGTES